MRLSEAKKNCLVEIVTVLKDELSSEDEKSFLLRMLELGLKPGARVRVRHIAPLGDPVTFEVNGSIIGITRRQCRFFEVSEVAE